MKCEVKELVKATQGELIKTSGPAYFCGVGTDTRKDLSDRLFIALRGASFDAHEFLAQAIQKGASTLLIQGKLPESIASEKVNVVRVSDTLKALQDFAKYWRHRQSAKIWALSGTNGKTTSKVFTGQVLSQFFKTSMIEKSWNNHWGVPFSLLDVDEQTKYAVVEMGMNQPGELRQLMAMGDPDGVVVTMVGRGHLEGLKTVDAIATEKETLYSEARRDAWRIFNLDNPWTEKMWQSYKSYPHLLTFSTDESKGSNICLRVKAVTKQGMQIDGHICGEKGEVTVPFFGPHNVYNLMVAASFASLSDLAPDQIWPALGECRMPWGRNQSIEGLNGTSILFDAYNANPESMKAMLDTISQIRAERKILILGDMLELGELASSCHEQLGEAVGRCPEISAIYFFGRFGESFARGLRAVDSQKNLVLSEGYKEGLASQISSMLSKGDLVAIKGSRGARLERWLDVLSVQRGSS